MHENQHEENGMTTPQVHELAPTVHGIRRHNGIAGQFSVTADVQYPDEPRRSLTFVGSVYGGPVVMQTGSVETFVTDPGRFGEFGVDWVRRFVEATS